MSQDLVSIVIPTYKGKEPLIRAIESVLEQDYSNIEVIVVDDNNPDTPERKRTEEIMELFLENAKVHYIKHSKNRNGAAARNTGINSVRGEYIAFLDDDDFFFPSKIRKQVEYLENHPEFAAVYCWRKVKDNVIKGELEGDLSSHILSLSFSPCTCALLVRTDVCKRLNGFDESYRRHQDFEFLLRFFKHYKIGVVKETLLELSVNGVDNALHGVELEELKSKFLNQFQIAINKLDTRNPGFKKKVYCIHFARVFKDHVKCHHFVMALRLWGKMTKIYGVCFTREIIRIL